MDPTDRPHVTAGKSPRRRGRPQAADSEATRLALLAAAEEVFWRHGYQGTSLGMIAERVGIGASAIYHYFSSKKDLYVETVTRCTGEVYDAFDAATADKAEMRDRVIAISHVAKAYHAQSTARALFVGACWSEMRRNPELAELEAAVTVRQKEFVQRMFHSGAQDAASRERAEQAECLYRLLSYGLAAIAAQNVGIAEFDRHADAMAAIIASTLRMPAGAAAG